MDILRLLEDLRSEIDKASSWGPITWGLNHDEVEMKITKIRASLPQELKEAVSTVRESERILEGAKEDATSTLDSARKESERIILEAKQEAERILEQAKIQQERMLAESEIIKLAKAQSEELRSNADKEANQMRRGAEKYAFDVLSQLEGVVGKVMTTIERGKQEMGPRDNTPERPRERTRV